MAFSLLTRKYSNYASLTPTNSTLHGANATNVTTAAAAANRALGSIGGAPGVAGGIGGGAGGLRALPLPTYPLAAHGHVTHPYMTHPSMTSSFFARGKSSLKFEVLVFMLVNSTRYNLLVIIFHNNIKCSITDATHGPKFALSI